MKRQLSIIVLAVFLAVLTFASSGSGRPGGSSNPDYVAGQVNVLLAPGASIDRVSQRYGVTLLDPMPGITCHRIGLRSGVAVESVVREMASDVEIRYAYPNFLVEPPEVGQASQAFLDPLDRPFLDRLKPATFYRQAALYGLHLKEALAKTTGAG